MTLSLEESLTAALGGGDAPHHPRQVGARTAELLLPTGRSSGEKPALSRVSRLEDYPSVVMGSLPCDKNKEPYQPERRLLRFRFL